MANFAIRHLDPTSSRQHTEAHGQSPSASPNDDEQSGHVVGNLAPADGPLSGARGSERSGQARHVGVERVGREIRAVRPHDGPQLLVQ